MGASDLLIEAPVLGSGTGRIDDREDISRRINEEFSLMGRNVRSFFDAIRLGLINPAEARDYIDRLVNLSERGRGRLNAVIIRQEEAGAAQASRAATVFGRVFQAAEAPLYSRSRLDRDRVLRRIAPVTDTEHIIVHALKDRWIESETENGKAGNIFVIRFNQNDEEKEYRFRLDSDGNILIEKPEKDKGFRRMGLEYFRNYERTDRAMARLAEDAKTLGVYAETIPEEIPFILYEHAETLKEELLADHEYFYNVIVDKLAAWVDARVKYFNALDEFLYSPSEMILVNRYEELIADEDDEDEAARLRNLRDELIRAFNAMREKHRELTDLRGVLSENINASFCILKPVSAGEDDYRESSALLANALLTGRSITPGRSFYIMLWTLSASFVLLLCIYRLRPLPLLATGAGVSLACGAAFAAGFIVSGYWIDPFIPAASCMGGVFVLAAVKFCINYGRELRFKLVFGQTVNRPMLRKLLMIGSPKPNETVCVHAAVIAVRNMSLAGMEDRKEPGETAKAAAEFREEFSYIFKEAGAQVLGYEGSTAFACFGSPLERICESGGHDPAQSAAHCVTAFLNKHGEDLPFSQWRFGVESGDCAFCWQEGIYAVSGRALARARIYASLASHEGVKAVIGETAKEEADIPAKKLSVLAGDSIYELRNKL
jgi:hypothetical protein